MLQNYVGMVGFKSNLIDKLGSVDADLPIFEEHIAALKRRLGAAGYTYLELRDGYNTEIIKVMSVCGNIEIERGLESTSPHTFPKGSYLGWIMTPGAVRDIVCQMDCC